MMSEERIQRDVEEANGTVAALHSKDVHSPSDITTKPLDPSSLEKVEMLTEDKAQADANADDVDGDSEAETLIQSPEKKKASVNHVLSSQTLDDPRGHSVIVAGAPTDEVQSRKRKRSANEGNNNPRSPQTSRRSSPLSSPVANALSDDSGSERSTGRKVRRMDKVREPKSGVREQSIEPEIKQETPRNRRRRPSEAGHHGHHQRKERNGAETSERRETRSATYPRHSDNERSPSPQSIAKREHRRGASTQLTTHELERRKRGRPPSLNTQRHRSADRTRSPDSDGSNSPPPPRSAIQRIAMHDTDTMSPAKTGPRKRRDKNGRTAVARHANSGNLDLVKIELTEHQEDLNLADNAGNTPLQIAALEGHIEIVEYLLSQGCDVDTRNIDKDTPLIDAVENGHVDVVRLLLHYGANPRVGNAKGDEPYELVPTDDENYDEIRALLADAKERDTVRNRAHEQSELKDRDGASSRAASAASPRDSPPVGPRSPPAYASRRRTGRSESTRNDLLWQAHNQPTLAKLAAKGDVQGVANILNSLQKAETESLIAAAKAGHEEVLQHLLAMGDPDPDPTPVRSLPVGFNTPLLAAIGRGHIDVVKLLVSQSGFDPTRRSAGKTYYELARERKGAGWQQEYDVLKSAFDRSTTGKGRKQASPRRTRDAEKVKARAMRRSTSPISQKKSSSSPTFTHKSLPIKSNESSPKEKRRSFGPTERRKPSGSKHETNESTVAVVSDLDQTVHSQKRGHRVRRSQSDLLAPRGDGDPPSRRRRLITGKEHRRNKSSAPASESSGEEPADMIEVKQEDKPVPSLKRTRSSQSPGLKQSDGVEAGRAVSKKRRTVESSPEEARVVPSKTPPHGLTQKTFADTNTRSVGEGPSRQRTFTSSIERDATSAANTGEQSSNASVLSNNTPGATSTPALGGTAPKGIALETTTSLDPVIIKQDTTDDQIMVGGEEIIPLAQSHGSAEINTRPVISQDNDAENKAEGGAAKAAAELIAETEAEKAAIIAAAAAAEKKEEEREEEEEAQRQEEARQHTERVAAQKAAAEEKAAEEKAAEEKAAEEKAAAEKAAAEKAAAEKAAAEKAAEEREAAEQAAAEKAASEKAEEEARKRAEEAALQQKKAEAQLQEQIRQEAELRRQQQDLERERQRISSLPAALSKSASMLDRNDPLVRDERWLKEKFLPLFTVNTRQLQADCPENMASTKWVPSFQVAGLLATKDLQLKAYPSLEKRPATKHERMRMWGVARHQLSFSFLINWGDGISIDESLEREKENRERFMALEDIHWVKLIDVQDQASKVSHLKDITLRTQPISLKTYREVFGQENTYRPTFAAKLANGVHLHNSSPNIGIERSASR